MMKKLTFSILFLSIAITSFCTTWTITNSGFTFSPPTLTIIEGDTVIFDLDNDHNSAEVSQITWNANGSTPLAGGWVTPFGGGMVLPGDLTVGTHWYVCQPHSSMGMKGMIIVEESTATDDARPGPAFSLYPNPSNGTVHLTAADIAVSKNYKVEVYDMHGVQVYTKAYSEPEEVNQIMLNNIAKGVYFVRFSNDEGVRSKRLVIQ